ncbi:amidophosphoribosyltransferase [Anaeromyxobacter diazotrophicus]|uniref:Amidophosphoribosyltransferase n=1 Tax=Anaeromyxobacter diazotrophicus TaxID=2590199 RepID=A0A7I9VMC1_9BACT|nr:amidophosphoribosyltransferase [Anaeromyxobacter diazotrophicus]GEJ57555.1 amidophosphoribosyltransferase [Anaeromyxobacter diazotrophicus]
MGYDAVYDKMKDECGVFGVWALGQSTEAANFTYLGLHALQHRGQESAGIVSTDGSALHVHRGMGLVADIFNAGELAKLPGGAAIGHVRYSTAGASHLKNAQPIAIQYAGGAVAVAHNGNLVNAETLRTELEAAGSIFQTTSDTEVILHLMARVRPGPAVPGSTEHHLAAIRAALARVSGAYSLLFLTERSMIGARDPQGFRPLVLGKLKGNWVLASETTALDLIEAEYVREIAPGEIVVIDEKGLRSEKLEPTAGPRRLARCVFEHIYFARPDSILFGRSVHEVRSSFGAQLAKDHPVEADVVIAVPDSGVPAAVGYARQSGIPYDVGLVRSHYIGRTFIEPQQSIRHFGVKLKLNAVRGVLRDKRVVVVDDSIVRGTTSRKIVKMIRDAGAKEVHLRISSPPTAWPCYYGIDTPTRQELIAATHSEPEIRDYVTADSLGYLSIDGLYAALGEARQGFCDACFTGEYVLEFPHSRPAAPLRLVGA